MRIEILNSQSNRYVCRVAAAPWVYANIARLNPDISVKQARAALRSGFTVTVGTCKYVPFLDTFPQDETAAHLYEDQQGGES